MLPLAFNALPTEYAQFARTDFTLTTTIFANRVLRTVHFAPQKHIAYRAIWEVDSPCLP